MINIPCFHPNYVTFSDGQFGRFGGKLTPGVLDSNNGEQIVPVPCGKCDGCRADRSKKWADRMLMEYNSPRCNRKALFVTLTYDNDHITLVECTDGVSRPTLVPRDVQLFMKRLRKKFPCRFYLSGEYGDTTFRPHYHLILFGIDSFGDDIPWTGLSEDGKALYMSPTLQSIWKNGNALYSPANWKTFAYVARYVLKKQFNSDLGNYEVYKGRVPPFSRCSRRPGIGADFFDASELELSTVVFDGDQLRTVSPPRCNFEKFKLTNSAEYDMLMSDRRALAESRQQFILDGTDLHYLDYLHDREVTFKGKINLLKKRGVE